MFMKKESILLPSLLYVEDSIPLSTVDIYIYIY